MSAKRGSIAWIVCGPAASGKSTFINKCGIARIDGDDIREALGVAQQQSQVSVPLKEDLLRLAIDLKANVAVPVGHPDRAEHFVRKLRDEHGYMVNVAIMINSDDERIRRCTKREYETGRESSTVILGPDYFNCLYDQYKGARAGRNGMLLVHRGVSEASAPCAIFVIGAQGAGKTTFCQNASELHSSMRRESARLGIRISDDAVVVDGELFHKMGSESRASLELTAIEHMALRPKIDDWKRATLLGAVAERRQIVLPVTGTSLFTDDKTIETLQRSGYVVHVIHLEVSLRHSLQACSKRAAQTGRPLADEDTFKVTETRAVGIARVANGTALTLPCDGFQFRCVC